MGDRKFTQVAGGAILLAASCLDIASARADVILTHRSEKLGVSLAGGPNCSTQTTPEMHRCSDHFSGSLGGQWLMFYNGDYVTLTGRGYFRMRWEMAWFNRPGQFVMPTFTDQQGTFLHVGDADYAGDALSLDPSAPYGKTELGQVNFTPPSTYDFAYSTIPSGSAMPWQNQYFYLDGSITIHENEGWADYNLGLSPVSYAQVLSDLNLAVGTAANIVRPGISYDPAVSAPVPMGATGLSAHMVGTGASLSWKACGGQVVGTQVEYSNNAPTQDGKGIMYRLATSMVGDRSSFTMGTLSPGRYTFRVRCYNQAGYSSYSNAIPVVVPATGPLPAGLKSADIGIDPKAATTDPTFGVAGFAGALNGGYQIGGSGSDIWNNADHFRFTYMPMNGDGTITARITDFNFTSSNAKAGLMVRETLDPGAAHAAVIGTPNHGLGFLYRATQGGGTNFAGTATGTTPSWLRMVRAGSVFTAKWSPDGKTWSTLGTRTISMGQSAYVGLAVTSAKTYPDLQSGNRYNDFKGYATAAFDNVTLAQ